MTPVFLRPDAELDGRAAAVWYDEEAPGLGEDFTDELFHHSANPAEEVIAQLRARR